MSRLAKHYEQQLPQLKELLKLDNLHQLPRLEKVVLNIGTGRGAGDKRFMEVATSTLKKISAQAPVPAKAKHSIAGFKLREGQPIGLKVTLRGARMWEFLDRLIQVVLPRMRDFHGLRRSSLDSSGNFTIGIPDQSVFPELTYEDTALTHGLEVTIVTKTIKPEHSLQLLETLGFPLERSPTRG